MFELLVLGAVGLAILAVIGLLWAVASLVCWVLVLPFKILGAVFQGLTFLLALPFLAIAALIGVAIFGVGLVFFLVPLLPVALFVALAWWLVHRRGRPAVAR